MTCKQCGAPIEQNERVCSYCRAAVEIEKTVGERIRDSGTSRNPSKEGTRRRVISNNGSRLGHDALADIADIFEEAFGKNVGEDIEKAFEEYRSTQTVQSKQNIDTHHTVLHNNSVFYPSTGTPAKDKIAAGLLAVFLGGIGVHKFYLGKIGQGILYLLFSWTFVPSIVALIEGIIYLTTSDKGWLQKVGYKI
jgi:TM2 domain-containing membrane protein YozV